MELLEWKPCIATHISEVDQQHKALFDFVNGVVRSVEEEVEEEILKQGLERLIDYTVFHFNTEEEILLKLKYPYLKKHQVEHRLITDQILRFKGNLRKHNKIDIVELIAFLRDWIKSHTASSDLEYAAYFIQLENPKINKQGRYDMENFETKNIANGIQVADLPLKAQILDQLPSPVIAVDRERRITYINLAGRKLVNKTNEELLGMACQDVFGSQHCGTEDCCMRKAIENGRQYSARNEIVINGDRLPFEYFAVPLKNELGEIIGGLEFIVDITERVLYEEKLREQSHAIREMSTPTIKLWEGVLVLPVVGVIDSMRAQYMMETMLTKIMETYSKIIILDIQGVAAVDTAVANHLIKITKATKLMGCECILSGISPAVAQTMIELGIDMGLTKTRATLSDALVEAFELLHLQVIKK